jgi:hypothetical protein
MAKAKFDRIASFEPETVSTHADLQNQANKKIGRPKGTKLKVETANVPLTIAITKTQKEELEVSAAKQMRSISGLIKSLLIENGYMK